MFENAKAEKIFKRNIKYFVTKKLKFIIDSESYIQEEDLEQELLYAAYHSYFHALKELGYSEENSIKYGRKSIENAAYRKIRDHNVQKKQAYIVTFVDGEQHFQKRKISIHKIEKDSFSLFGENIDQENIEQKEILSKIMEHLTSKELHIFKEFALNNFMNLRGIAETNGSSLFTMKRKLKQAMRLVLKHRDLTSKSQVG